MKCNTQQNNYYFGPAAVRMALAYCGYNYSQATLASMLGTTSSSETAAGDTIPNVMNNITAGSTYKFYWIWQNDLTYTALFKQHCFADLVNAAHKNPIVVNTLEDAGVPILKEHEVYGRLDHFGVVNGIFQSGDMVKYTDPGYGLFSGFVKEQNVTLVNMCRALGGKGYVY